MRNLLAHTEQVTCEKQGPGGLRTHWERFRLVRHSQTPVLESLQGRPGLPISPQGRERPILYLASWDLKKKSLP